MSILVKEHHRQYSAKKSLFW